MIPDFEESTQLLKYDMWCRLMWHVPLFRSNMCVALYTNFKQKDKSQQGSSGDNAGSNVNATLHTQVKKFVEKQ